MKRKVIETADGSSTILIEDWGESFHSVHGAIQEAQHVYIQNGLQFSLNKNPNELRILEIGFGSGLNCFLTNVTAQDSKVKIYYTGVEGYPLSKEEWSKLNYYRFFEADFRSLFFNLHEFDWEVPQLVSEQFQLTKKHLFFHDIEFENEFDLVYFDAFGYQYQPELWSEEIFTKIKKALKPNGVLVTYACKGVVNRTLKALGFQIEKIEGPPGKREMTRAILV